MEDRARQRGRSSTRQQSDDTSYRRVRFKDQQAEHFDDVPPQNYSTNPQPRRFQAPSSGWNDNYRREHGAALVYVFRGHHRGGPIPARGMVASSPTPLLLWVMDAGLEDPVEVLPGEVSASTATVAEVSRGTAAVLETVRRTRDQPSVTRTPHHVPALAQSYAQAVVEVEVAVVLCVGDSIATVATTWMSRQLSSAATSNHGHRQSHPTTAHREKGPRSPPTGNRAPSPPIRPQSQ